jgi:hypothetical protein
VLGQIRSWKSDGRVAIESVVGRLYADTQGNFMNKLKARLKSGKACVNAWLVIVSQDKTN